MNIRKATLGDEKVILNFIEMKAQFDREMKGFEGQVTSSVDKIRNTLFIDAPFAHALLLEENSEMLGFALYHYRYSSFKVQPSIWLDDLLVNSASRSKGYGHHLMQALISEATKVEASHIAWTASPYNTRGQAFYQRIGAQIEKMEGERPFYRLVVDS